MLEVFLTEPLIAKRCHRHTTLPTRLGKSYFHPKSYCCSVLVGAHQSLTLHTMQRCTRKRVTASSVPCLVVRLLLSHALSHCDMGTDTQYACIVLTSCQAPLWHISYPADLCCKQCSPGIHQWPLGTELCHAVPNLYFCSVTIICRCFRAGPKLDRFEASSCFHC